jgi:hypothetical protein
MFLAAEAELGALYLNACKVVSCQTLLNKLGHKQPPTPIQTDNSSALGVVTNSILPRCTKAMDIRFWWLHNRDEQDNFDTTGARVLPTAATTSQNTSALPPMPRTYWSSLPRPSSSMPYAPSPTGARPPREKVSCSRHTLSQRQQPKTQTLKLESLKGCARYPKVPILCCED